MGKSKYLTFNGELIRTHYNY